MKNLKEWKTSLIGFILMGFSIYGYYWQNDQDWTALVVFCLGVAFLFFPDSIILNIKKFLNRKGRES